MSIMEDVKNAAAFANSEIFYYFIIGYQLKYSIHTFLSISILTKIASI